MSETSPPAGWYPAPDQPGQNCYQAGQQMTGLALVPHRTIQKMQRIFKRVIFGDLVCLLVGLGCYIYTREWWILAWCVFGLGLSAALVKVYHSFSDLSISVDDRELAINGNSAKSWPYTQIHSVSLRPSPDDPESQELKIILDDAERTNELLGEFTVGDPQATHALDLITSKLKTSRNA